MIVKKMDKGKFDVPALHRCGTKDVAGKRVPSGDARLQDLGQFGRERAARSLVPVLAAAWFAVGSWLGPRRTGWRTGWRTRARRSLLRSARSVLALGRLGRVGPEQPVFQRCAVETADDGRHFVGRGRFDE